MAEKEAIINKLPDEVLIDIISLLTTTDEAVRTCVISKRWLHLWKHVSRINITYDQTKLPKKELSIEVVNKVLEVHQRETLDEFKIDAPIRGRYHSERITRIGRAVESWLVFAMRKGVQRLDIDLEGDDYEPYSSDSKTIFENPGDGPIVFPKLLKHLSLNFLNVGGDLVEQFLSNCPFLEHLCVSGSTMLKDLRVVGGSLQLKLLQISNCLNLLKVEIFAPNLESFIFDGIQQHKTIFLFNHAPALVNVSLGDEGEYIHQSFGAVSSYFSQLETLKLDLNAHRAMSCHYKTRTMNLPLFSELASLKELSLSYNIILENDVINPYHLKLSPLTCLVKRSPFLRKFTFELSWRHVDVRRWQKKLAGFIVCTGDPNVAIYLLENAGMLQNKFEEDVNSFEYVFRKRIFKRPSVFETTLVIKENLLPSGIQEYMRQCSFIAQEYGLV